MRRLLAFGVAMLVALPAHAQIGVVAPPPPPPISFGTAPGAAPFWSRGEPRPFVSTTTEVGYLYARPRFSFGYGQPHWKWIGAEVAPVVSGAAFATYGGIQAALPLVQLRVGTFYNVPFSRSFLHKQDSYDRFDIEILNGPSSRYFLSIAELAGTVPLPFGALVGTLGGYRVDGVPSGYNVFEEQLHLVVTAPYFWRVRAGYVLSFGEAHTVNLGVLGDYIDVPYRGTHIVRAGIVTGVTITPKVDVVASFIPVVISPDRLGITGGDFTQLGLRIKWATGLKGEDAVLLP